MRNEDFEQWVPLIHHIIKNHFGWSYVPNGGGSFRTSRTVDYNDLVSEGSIALIHSWRKFDSTRKEASFKTYAYRAIMRRLRKFIDSTISPISTKNWRDHVSRGEPTSKVAAAYCASLFSEHADGNEGQIPDTHHIEDFDNLEWKDHCIETLKRNLTTQEMAILKERYSGMTFTQIAKRRGTTRETARKLHSELIVKAYSILKGNDDD